VSASIFGKSRSNQPEEENHWLSVSDLMAGLMMVFLFISIVLMRNALLERDKVKELADTSQKLAKTYQIERDKIRQIAATYQDTKISIYKALMIEFEGDLSRWDAEINKENLSFNFKSPDVLFAIGKIDLKSKFKEILSNFFPRYMKVINEFKDSIEEVRIEGHTSSRWNGSSNDEAYFLNMDLSQGRTRSVLSYIYGLDSVTTEREWIKKNVAAVGYSSSKIILKDGVEDAEHSRRVTFKLISNSEIQILKIIGE
jgi:outer membrane protein OmpA-like peptidoglycan-associated protein